MLKTLIYKNMYQDSVKLMLLSQNIKKLDGINECSAMMATTNNLDIIKAVGLLTEEAESASPDDIVIVIDADTEQALENGEIYAKDDLEGRHRILKNDDVNLSVRTIKSAKSVLEDINIALISVPGKYAAEVAHKVIDENINPMLFSDNVTLKEELDLKQRANEKGLIVMGPDCGTSIISGIGLGFGNKVYSGNVGIIGASGTGIQEVVSLLDLNNVGISHAIGTGGRDLNPVIGAVSTLKGIEILSTDKQTEYIVIVSKPAEEDILIRIEDALQKSGKTSVIIMVGMDLSKVVSNDRVIYSDSLKDGVEQILRCCINKEYKEENKIFNQDKNYDSLCGLYTGGTLAYEALNILSKRCNLKVSSNISFHGIDKAEDVFNLNGSFIIDLGEDKLTSGRAHPMINPSLRNELIEKLAHGKEACVIILDFVLGYGSNEDPVGAALPYILRNRELRREKGYDETIFLAHVCGTKQDPQGYSNQIEKLAMHNISVFGSNDSMIKYGLLLTKGGTLNE